MTIPKLVLDKQNDAELLQQAYTRVYNASNGVLNANQSGSALLALLEGQVYLTAELLWYLNMLPEALALEVFRLTGVERKLGTKAVGNLTVFLSMVLTSPFILSKGTIIDQYVLTDTLYIPPGNTQSTVPIEALNIGSSGNKKAYALSVGTLTTYMQGAFNNEPIQGGNDLEDLDTYIERVQLSLRQRDTLVSLEDYQEAAISYMGLGGVATTFPLISANKQTKTLGHTHTFIAYADGTLPSLALCASVQEQMQERVFIGAASWVSRADFQPITIDIVAAVDSLSITLADDIYDALVDYLSPKSYKIGATVEINELEYIARSVDGVNRVTTCFIDNAGLSVGMPTFYTYPQIDTASITLVDRLGRSTTYYRGTGDGDTE